MLRRHHPTHWLSALPYRRVKNGCTRAISQRMTVRLAKMLLGTRGYNTPNHTVCLVGGTHPQVDVVHLSEERPDGVVRAPVVQHQETHIAGRHKGGHVETVEAVDHLSGVCQCAGRGVKGEAGDGVERESKGKGEEGRRLCYNRTWSPARWFLLVAPSQEDTDVMGCGAGTLSYSSSATRRALRRQVRVRATATAPYVSVLSCQFYRPRRVAFGVYLCVRSAYPVACV